MERKKKEFTIAVVDDSDISRRSIVEILTDKGFNVVGDTSNAQDALKIAAQHQPTLFLIDLVMPEIGGAELAKLLSEQGLAYYIVMMSSLNLESVVVESISSGALDFLVKPFEEAELLKIVEKIELEYQKD